MAAASPAAGRPIRTVLFSTLYPSSARPGHGIFVETRLRELLKTGRVEVRVLAPVPWFPSTNPRFGDWARMAQTPHQERHNGIEVWHPRYVLPPKVGMHVAPYSLAWAARRQLQQWQAEGWDFDLIDAHYYYPDGVAAGMLARRFNKPLVVTARGSDLSFIPQYPRPRRLIARTAQRAEASVGVCGALVDVLRDMGVAEQRLHVLRNGVDLQRFVPHERAAMRTELGLPADAPLILSVGNWVELKGYHLVIEALQALPDAHYLLIGSGEEEARLRALAQQLGVAERVSFVGRVANELLARWYSAADVLVLASSREGWPNVLLEAMACGTPVVATRIWGTPEIVQTSAVGVLVDERSATALAGAISGVLAAPPDRQSVRTYAEGFSWQATSAGQADLFEQILKTRERVDA